MYLYVTVSCGVLVMINFGSSVNVVRCNFEKSISLTDGGKSIRTVRTSRTTTVWDTYYNYYPTDKPWITGHIKQLIKERQRAFHTGDEQLWRQYRRRVQIQIKTRKSNFYTQKIHNLRKDDVRQWWHTINTMSGRAKSQPQFTIERDGQLLSEGKLAESLNDYFVSVANDIPPLDISSLPTFLPAAVPPPTIHPHVMRFVVRS